MDIVTFVTMPVAFGGVGAFLTIRVPRNPIGPMLLFATIGFALLIGGGSWVIARTGVSGALVEQPDAAIAGLIANLCSFPPWSSSSSASRWSSRTGICSRRAGDG